VCWGLCCVFLDSVINSSSPDIYSLEHLDTPERDYK